jgi:hypothetical protein
MAIIRHHSGPELPTLVAAMEANPVLLVVGAELQRLPHLEGTTGGRVRGLRLSAQGPWHRMYFVNPPSSADDSDCTFLLFTPENCPARSAQFV